LSDLLLSVIIPVYNEESTVAELVKLVREVELPLRKEIIVVNDGSTDQTSEQLSGISGLVDKLCLLPFNQGKGAAVREGLRWINGDVILLQDADLELDPNEYALLLEPIISGKSDIVYGTRLLIRQSGVPLLRYVGNRLLTTVTNMLYGTKLTDMETAYKVFTREVAQKLHLQSTGFEIEPEITAQIVRAGHSILEVPITYRPRSKSEGKKIRWYDTFTALRMLWKYRLKFRALSLNRSIHPSNDKISY
jgi:glycosyltransferase involved in cell wall biosynthesis